MSHYVTGETIRTLREKKKLTQKQLAELVCVSDKAVSKWETGNGLPDISLLEPLAQALQVSVAELLSGDCRENRNRSANQLKGCFYVCPVCGNIIHASGEGSFSCCGIVLPPLEAEQPDDAHALQVERCDDRYYLTAAHPMTKEHYLSFVAYVTGDKVMLTKLYPEQNPEVSFPIAGSGKFYWLCNRHGLFCQTTGLKK